MKLVKPVFHTDHRIQSVFCGVPGTLIVNGVRTPEIPPNGDSQVYSLTGQEV